MLRIPVLVGTNGWTHHGEFALIFVCLYIVISGCNVHPRLSYLVSRIPILVWPWICARAVCLVG